MTPPDGARAPKHRQRGATTASPPSESSPAPESNDVLRDQRDELLASQQLLEQSRDDYAELFNLAPLPLLCLVPSGAICRVNDAAAAFFDVPRARLVGRLFQTLVEAPQRTTLIPRLHANLTGAIEKHDLYLMARGALVPVQLWVRTSPRRGQVLHVTILDRAEQQRETVEKQRLIDAERRAREASHSKDQFIAMLSHELRTPLTPVMVAASSLSRSDLNDEQRRLIDMIRRNASAEARLVDDLLDATGIVHGKLSLVTHAVEIHTLVGDCVEGIRDAAQRRGLSLCFVPEAPQSFVQGDAVRLRQVFSNLLGNAVKFTPPPGEISVRSWNNGGEIIIEVQDSGIGFQPSAVPRMFAAFEQLTRDTAAPGLGLGLAITKGLVELHGGTISAASVGPNRGARFLVTLPTLAVTENAAESPPLESKRSVSSPARRHRILLVEDDPDTAEIIQLVLEEEGYTVEVARSVAAARATDFTTVDAIVSDIGLPDGTGADLIRHLPCDPKPPAIALSGYGMREDIDSSRNAGFAMHLTKPVNLDRLLSALEEVLRTGPSDLLSKQAG